MLSFRVDAETHEMLQALEEGEGPSVRGRRSILLRRLIRQEHAKKR